MAKKSAIQKNLNKEKQDEIIEKKCDNIEISDTKKEINIKSDEHIIEKSSSDSKKNKSPKKKSKKESDSKANSENKLNKDIEKNYNIEKNIKNKKQKSKLNCNNPDNYLYEEKQVEVDEMKCYDIEISDIKKETNIKSDEYIINKSPQTQS
jgi:hypothetical protein